MVEGVDGQGFCSLPYPTWCSVLHTIDAKKYGRTRVNYLPREQTGGTTDACGDMEIVS